MVNKFPGRCASCGTQVAGGAGQAIRLNGQWKVVCRSAACHRALGSGDANPATFAAPAGIDATGIVRFPYDPDRVALVRVMPGARWDADGKHWTVSTASGDLPRLLELAAKARLEVAPELVARASEGTPESREADARAAREGLYGFQRAGVRFLALHPRALLADGMGAGKTIQTLVALPESARVLVVCPAVVKYNWQNEAAKWRPDYRTSVLSGKGSFRLPEPGEIVITNYDVLPSNVPDASGVTIVLDEAHACKNRKALRTKRATKLCETADRVWLLSGTPMTNKPFDLWTVLDTAGLAKNVFGHWKKFLTLFDARQNQWGGWEFGAVDPQVGERLRRVMIRRTLEEVLPDLPSFRFQTIDINGLSKGVTKILDEIGEEYKAELEVGVLPPFERLSAVRAELAEERIPAMLDLVEQYEESDEPLIVFSAHRAPIDALSSREGWAVITGDTNPQDRTAIVARFQAGELRGVGLTIAAGGVGITLTRASTVLFVDRDWTPANNCQAEDRIRRIGQKAASLSCVVLTANHPVDKRVQQLLEEKNKRFRDAMTARLGEAKPVADVALIEETDEELAARLATAREAAEKVERSFWLDRISGQIEKVRTRVGTTGLDDQELVLDDAKRASIRRAFDWMIARCDGAETKDGAGFNKPDAAVMHWIDAAGGFVSDDTYRLVEMTLRLYAKQLRGMGT